MKDFIPGRTFQIICVAKRIPNPYLPAELRDQYAEYWYDALSGEATMSLKTEEVDGVKHEKKVVKFQDKEYPFLRIGSGLYSSALALIVDNDEKWKLCTNIPAPGFGTEKAIWREYEKTMRLKHFGLPSP